MNRCLSGCSAAAVLALTSIAALAQTPMPPAVGAAAPNFSLRSLDDATVSLAAERARGPVVLIVGRGWIGYQCPFCNRQFGDFVTRAREIDAAGARVIWVYPGPTDGIRERAQEFAAGREFPANFRFVLDPDFGVTTTYALRWNAPNETAYPATFVIDRDGIVRFAKVSRSHAGRATAAEVLAVLTSLKKQPAR